MTVVAAVVAGFVVLTYLALAVVAVRRPLLARIAYRQIARRRWQSALLVAGMMFSTTAVLGMAGGVDTLNLYFTQQVYARWGHTDLTVTAGGQLFDSAVAARLASDPSLTGKLSGVAGGLDLAGSVADLDRELSVPTVPAIGFDPASRAAFGVFNLTDGRRLSAPQLKPGETVLAQPVADRLQARPGDRLLVLLGHGQQVVRLELRLAGTAVQDQDAGGYGLLPAMFIPLATLQEALHTNRLNVVRLSAPGTGLDEVTAAHGAVPLVREVLTGMPEAAGLELREVKRDDLRENERSGIGTIKPAFVVLSMLVVLGAVALVVNMMLALAEERRPRIAVVRALGLSRSGIVLMTVMEASFYALAGAVLGVAPGLAYAYYEAVLKPLPGFALSGFGRQFTVASDSLVLAVCLGTFVTLATVLAVGVRTSRMSIASAIKNLPEPTRSDRTTWFRAVWITALGLAGLAAVVAGSIPIRELGGAAFIVASAAALRGRLPERARATLAGGGILLWALALDLAAVSVDLSLQATTWLVTLVVTVFGFSVLAAANLRLVEHLLAAGSTRLGATTRPPLAYMTRRPIRTGLSIGTFGLLLAAIAAFGLLLGSFVTLIEKTAGWDVVVTSTANPSLALPAELQGRTAEQTQMLTATYFGPLRVTSTTNSGNTSGWHQAQRTFYLLTDEQLARQPLTLGGWERRYPDEAAVYRALADDPGLVICPGGASSDELYLGRSDIPSRFHVAGVPASPFPEITGNWCLASRRAMAAIPSPTLGTTILVRLQAGQNPAAFALDVRRQMFAEGVDAVTVQEFQDLSRRSLTWFVTIFTDLFQFGLVVGVLALALLALRAVVERRRAIGVLRALGYQPRNVLVAFFVETLLTATIGIAGGLALGLPLGGLFMAGAPFAHRLTPRVDWGLIATPVLLVYAAAVVATLAPALRAARIPTADALRLVD